MPQAGNDLCVVLVFCFVVRSIERQLTQVHGPREANALNISFGFDETRQKHHEKQTLQQGVHADSIPEPNNDAADPNRLKGQTERLGFQFLTLYCPSPSPNFHGAENFRKRRVRAYHRVQPYGPHIRLTLDI